MHNPRTGYVTLHGPLLYGFGSHATPMIDESIMVSGLGSVLRLSNPVWRVIRQLHSNHSIRSYITIENEDSIPSITVRISAGVGCRRRSQYSQVSGKHIVATEQGIFSTTLSKLSSNQICGLPYRSRHNPACARTASLLYIRSAFNPSTGETNALV